MRVVKKPQWRGVKQNFRGRVNSISHATRKFLGWKAEIFADRFTYVLVSWFDTGHYSLIFNPAGSSSIPSANCAGQQHSSYDLCRHNRRNLRSVVDRRQFHHVPSRPLTTCETDQPILKRFEGYSTRLRSTRTGKYRRIKHIQIHCHVDCTCPHPFTNFSR